MGFPATEGMVCFISKIIFLKPGLPLIWADRLHSSEPGGWDYKEVNVVACR